MKAGLCKTACLISSLLTVCALAVVSARNSEFRHYSHETQMIVQAGNNATLRCLEAENGALVVTLKWICLGCNPDSSSGDLSSMDPPIIVQHSANNAGNRPTDLVSFQSDSVTYYHNEGRMILSTADRFALAFTRVATGDSGLYGCLLNDRSHVESVTKLLVQDVPAPPGRAYVTGFTSRAMNLSWAPSIDDHNSPISHYVIHARVGEQGEWQPGSPGMREIITNVTSVQITDLQPFTVYTFRVSAVNTLGPSPPSLTSYALATMREVPSGRPTIIKASNTSSTSIFVRWASPPSSSLHGEFLGYQLTYEERYSPASSGEFSKDGFPDPASAAINDEDYDGRSPPEVVDIKGPGVTEITLTDLKAYTQYIISLRVKNPVGMGPPTKVIVMTDEGVPSPPVNVTVLRMTDVEVDLSWMPPEMPNGIVEGYRVYFITGNYTDVRSVPNPLVNKGLLLQHQQKIYDALAAAADAKGKIKGNETDVEEEATRRTLANSILAASEDGLLVYRLSDLAPYTKYKIWIKAYTRNNEGSPSSPVILQTDVGSPGPPHIANLTCRPPHSLVVQWLRPQEANGAIDFYHVFYRDIDVQRPGEEEELVIASSIDQTSHSLLLPNLTDGGVYEIRIQGRARSLFDPDSIYEGAYSEMRKALVTGNCRAAWSSTSATQDHRGVHPLGLKIRPTLLAGAACGAFAMLLAILAVVLWRRNMKAHRGSLDNCEIGESKQAPSFGSSSSSNGSNSNKPRDGVVIGNNGNMASSNDQGQENAIPLALFPAHVARLHADADLGFAKEFEALQTATGSIYPSSVAQRAENKEKNRYQNVLAYDHSLVPLKPKVNKKNTTPSALPPNEVRSADYINANFVDGWNKPDAYIATQGPLPKTTPAFWRMIWEHKVKTVVMITNLVERGRNKCDQYWPSEGMEQYGCIQVRATGEVQRATYTLRKFLIKKVKSKCASAPKQETTGMSRQSSAKAARGEREVIQWHFTAWPDHATPPCPVALLHFVRRSAQSNPSNAGPIVVHCSAGVGRTGTYIVIDAVLAQMKTEQRLGVYDFLGQIRKQRNSLVQTEEQYVFIHDALLAASEGGDTDVTIDKLTSRVKAMAASDELFNQWKLLNTGSAGLADVSAAAIDVNRGKNRDGDHVPSECNRACLTARSEQVGSDYINASYVAGFHYAKEFIVTQHPLPHTVGDFWRLVWENRVQNVLMFSTTDYQSYPCFWPEVGSESLHVDGLRISLESERTVASYPELKLRVSRETADDNDDDDECLSTSLILAPGWPNAQSKEPLALIKDILKIRESKPKSEIPWIIMDRFGGVEATTFCCLSALYEQMQIDKQVDIFLHASLCQQARPNVWRKQDDFLFLYKTLTGLELDVGTWSKKRYSYANNRSQQQQRPSLPNNGYPAVIDPNYGGMAAATLGPAYRSHQMQYSPAGYHTLPGRADAVQFQETAINGHHSTDTGYYSSQHDTDESSSARNSSVSDGYPPGFYDGYYAVAQQAAAAAAAAAASASANNSPAKSHPFHHVGNNGNCRSSSEASVVTVIEAGRGQYQQLPHHVRFPPEGKESPFGCPTEILSPMEPSLVDHQLGLRMDLV